MSWVHVAQMNRNPIGSQFKVVEETFDILDTERTEEQLPEAMQWDSGESYHHGCRLPTIPT